MDRDLIPHLQRMVESNGSDLFLSVGAPPNVRVEGLTVALAGPCLQPGDVKALAYGIMTEKQIARFESKLEMNFALNAAPIGRFRVNVYQQRGETAMVVRYIK